jgi:hypothetical protein
VAPSVRQTNFSAGELAPLYWGRTDLAVFARGLRRCRNFMVLKSGAAMSRPGTKFVREAKSIDWASITLDIPDRPVRLVPFVFSDRKSYVLEFGQYYIRFHTLGSALLNGGGTPFELVTTYQAKDLWKLRFAQVGNVMSIAATGYAAQELRRSGDTEWSLTETSFTPPSAVFPDVGDSYAPSFSASPPLNVVTTPFMVVLPAPVEDSDHPAVEWVHACTAIMQHRGTGQILESKAEVVRYSTDGVETYPLGTPVQTQLTSQKWVIYPDKPLTLKRLMLTGGPDPEFRTLGFRIYRGRGDLLGHIGDTASREFIDLGREPDYSVQPPLGTQPFRRPLLGLVFLERPVSVGFFQERRVFGGGSIATGRTAVAPGVWIGGDDLGRVDTLFASAVGDYYNFDERLAFDVSGESLTLTIAARRREHIKHLVALERLVVLTNSSVWTLGGAGGSPLDFDSIDMRLNDDVGSSDVTPVVVDGAVLFVRTKGSGARALVPQASDTPYQGVNISEFSSHLFVGQGRAVVDWCYAEDPWGVVWAAREDGALLSLTFDRGREMAAWARHDTDGSVEAVCAVPEGAEDAVYLVVRREVAGTEHRFIERMTSRVRRVLEDDEDPTFIETPSVDDTDTLYPTDACLDCGVTFAAPITSLGIYPNTIVDPKLANLIGKQVYVVARGSPLFGPITVEANGVNGALGIDFPEDPTPNAVDSAGVPIWVAHIGLAYTCELETLDVAGGEARLRKKTIERAGFEVDNARGLKVGQDFDHLKEWRQRQVADSYDSISAATALVDTPVASTWDQGARVVLRQDLPLPVTVVGVTRKLAVDEG